MYQHPDGSQLNVVEPILQDRAGSIWFGGRMGLSRLTQRQVRKISTMDKASKRMARDNIVSAIYQDGTGQSGPAHGMASPNVRVRTLYQNPLAGGPAASTPSSATALAIYG